MRKEKKYEVLPGVEIPDIKKIQEAASDFSTSDVGGVEIRSVTLQPVTRTEVQSVSSSDLSQLQQLGDQVAEEEEKSKAESRAKMDVIMNRAVQAPESIVDLKASHIAQMNEEKRKEMEENMKVIEQKQAEEDAKNKVREERRKLQQRLLEESREKAARERAEKERFEKEAAAVDPESADREIETEEISAQVPEKNIETEPVIKKKAQIVSDDEAFDDFREFLEDPEDE